ncbi:MAG: hypothetical protein ACK46Q_14975, partial [Hyphomonas sp.]
RRRCSRALSAPQWMRGGWSEGRPPGQPGGRSTCRRPVVPDAMTEARRRVSGQDAEMRGLVRKSATKFRRSAADRQMPRGGAVILARIVAAGFVWPT